MGTYWRFYGKQFLIKNAIYGSYKVKSFYLQGGNKSKTISVISKSNKHYEQWIMKETCCLSVFFALHKDKPLYKYIFPLKYLFSTSNCRRSLKEVMARKMIMLTSWNEPMGKQETLVQRLDG